MIAVDTNILVQCHRSEMPCNGDAFELIKKLASGAHRWAIPWPCISEFYSTVTRKGPWKGKESTPHEAWAEIRNWLTSPSVLLLSETEMTLGELERLSIAAHVRGPLIHDARIAALCLSHGVDTLLTTDRDFSRFPGLKIKNPFES